MIPWPWLIVPLCLGIVAGYWICCLEFRHLARKLMAKNASKKVNARRKRKAKREGTACIGFVDDDGPKVAM